MLSSSRCGGLQIKDKNEKKDLQSLSAISIGSVNVLPSDLNDVGRDDLLLCLLITLFNNFQVVLRLFLAFSNLEL